MPCVGDCPQNMSVARFSSEWTSLLQDMKVIGEDDVCVGVGVSGVGVWLLCLCGVSVCVCVDGCVRLRAHSLDSNPRDKLSATMTHRWTLATWSLCLSHTHTHTQRHTHTHTHTNTRTHTHTLNRSRNS